MRVHSRLFGFIVWTIGLLALDQAVKAWARSAFQEGEKPGFPWPGVFEITLTYNKGIAFGMFPGGGVFFVPVAVAIAFAAGWYSYKHQSESRMLHFAMALLAAGAIGNLIDRIWRGKVTDMFWIRAIDFPVFNIADTCITFAAIILGWRWFRDTLPAKSAGSPQIAELQQPQADADSQLSQLPK